MFGEETLSFAFSSRASLRVVFAFYIASVSGRKWADAVRMAIVASAFGFFGLNATVRWAATHSHIHSLCRGIRQATDKHLHSIVRSSYFAVSFRGLVVRGGYCRRTSLPFATSSLP